MIGGNRVAARYAAIPVGRRLIEVYTLSGVLAFLAAVCFTAHDGAASQASSTPSTNSRSTPLSGTNWISRFSASSFEPAIGLTRNQPPLRATVASFRASTRLACNFASSSSSVRAEAHCCSTR